MATALTKTASRGVRFRANCPANLQASLRVSLRPAPQTDANYSLPNTARQAIIPGLDSDVVVREDSPR